MRNESIFVSYFQNHPTRHHNQTYTPQIIMEYLYTQAHTYGLSEWKNPGNKKCTFEFTWREKQQEHPTENHQP